MASGRVSVAAVVVSYNSAQWLPACLEALLRGSPPPDDVVVGEDTLARLAGALADDPGAALAGAKLLFPDGKTIQHAGGTLDYPLALARHYGYGEEDRGQHDQPREVDYVTGALLALKRSALREIGLFDEGFHPAYFEEADLCARARRAGRKVVYVPAAVAVHHESVTTGRDSPDYYRFYHRGRLRYVLKHYSDEQVWRDFLPAERGRLESEGTGPAESAALLHAYSHGLATLEALSWPATSPTEELALPRSRLKAEALRILRASAEQKVQADAEGDEVRYDRTADLIAKCQLTEPTFTSHVPILAGAIVRIRSLWNWMSTKWYVGDLVRQQNEFNSAMAETLRAIESSSIECERMTVRLNSDVARLQRRVEGIERHLEQIQSLLEQRLAADSQQTTDSRPG